MQGRCVHQPVPIEQSQADKTWSRRAARSLRSGPSSTLRVYRPKPRRAPRCFPSPMPEPFQDTWRCIPHAAEPRRWFGHRLATSIRMCLDDFDAVASGGAPSIGASGAKEITRYEAVFGSPARLMEDDACLSEYRSRVSKAIDGIIADDLFELGAPMVERLTSP